MCFTLMNKIERIKELVELLNHYRNEYYNNQNSEISDFEYDTLFDELSSLEQETGFIMTVSPTQTVGYEVKSELTKVKHNHHMLSLDKTKDINDIVKFLDGREGVIMAKMDGLTCSLRYLNGELVSAETRGNGEVGEDILHCAKTIKNIPLRIECLDEVIVDGEVIITYDDFEKINSTLPVDKQYKNPRNLASGSIRQLDSSVAAKRNMKFIAWKLVKGWMSCTGVGLMNKNFFKDRLRLLEHLGFEVVNYIEISKLVATDERQINKCIEWIKTDCEACGHPIDGCVIGYDDIKYGESLGATEHHLRSQIAFKFYDELYETKLQYIDWTLGKTGVLTPTAVFDPVEIDGTEITRASLHNISIIKSLGLANDCTVRIYKANQIIPQVDSCDNDGSEEVVIPNSCPVCGGKTAIKKDNESEVLVCTNPTCSGKRLAQFVHFASRKCLNIDGLSEATLEKLISLGHINNFKDIYHLSNHYDKLIQLDGFGAKSVEKLLQAIEKSRDVKLENFITALGIPNIGLSAAKTISNYFQGNYDKFIQAYRDCFDWTWLDDFGVVMSESLENYLDEYFEDVNILAAEMRFIEHECKEVVDNPFSGKTLCVTGKLNHFTRDSINEKIISLGSKAASSVSKKTDYLITNEQSGSSKYKKALELNISIITEDEFLKMIGGTIHEEAVE